MASGQYDIPTGQGEPRDSAPLSEPPTLRRPRRRPTDERGRQLYQAEDSIETPLTWSPFVPLFIPIVLAGVVAATLLLNAGVMGGGSLALQTPIPPSESPWQLEPKVTLAHVYAALAELEAGGEGSFPLEGVTLEGVTLEGASSEGAPLEGVTLEGATSEGATLEGATLEGATAVLNQPASASNHDGELAQATDNPY